jgi:hypothetical protein
MDKPLQFSYDQAKDVITIEGIKYAGDLFRGLGFGLQHGQLFRVVSRDAGVLTLQSPPSNAPLPALLTPQPATPSHVAPTAATTATTKA